MISINNILLQKVEVQKERYIFAPLRRFTYQNVYKSKPKHVNHYVIKRVLVSSLVMSNSLRPHGPQHSMLLCPWYCPGKNTGVGCYLLLQRIFLTQKDPMSPVFPESQANPLYAEPPEKPYDMTKTGKNQLGPRWQKTGLPIGLESH